MQLHPTQVVREKALRLSIKSYTDFEQPRNANGYTSMRWFNRPTTEEYLTRAKIFEQYLTFGTTERKTGEETTVEPDANGHYTSEPECEEGDIMTVKDYLEQVKTRVLIDYDGSGYPMKDGLIDRSITLVPSQGDDNIPDDATHVIWYNR